MSSARYDGDIDDDDFFDPLDLSDDDEWEVFDDDEHWEWDDDDESH